MIRRIALLVLVTTALALLRPSWATVDWSDPITWLATARIEDAFAATARILALWLCGLQLAGLAAAGLARAVGSSSLERWSRRILVPALRTVAPLALVAGTALPATALDTRIPIVPPRARTLEAPAPSGATSAPDVVVVEAGDSMWSIAADHARHDVADFWRELVDLNRHRFDDVNLIHPGDRILLPAVSRRD